MELKEYPPQPEWGKCEMMDQIRWGNACREIDRENAATIQSEYYRMREALSYKALGAELVLHGLIDAVALDDPIGYDDGETAHALRCLSERLLTPNEQN